MVCWIMGHPGQRSPHICPCSETLEQREASHCRLRTPLPRIMWSLYNKLDEVRQVVGKTRTFVFWLSVILSFMPCGLPEYCNFFLYLCFLTSEEFAFIFIFFCCVYCYAPNSEANSLNAKTYLTINLILKRQSHPNCCNLYSRDIKIQGDTVMWLNLC